MQVDQSEIDGLLAEANSLATEAAPDAQAPPPPPSPTPVAPDVARILRIRVPVIVQLATRTLRVAVIRKLTGGAIIEFEKAVTEDLDLLINNHPIGRGVCVKVGEHFGIRLTHIADRVERIKSMGS